MNPQKISFFRKLYLYPVNLVRNLATGVREGVQEVIDEHRAHLPNPPGYVEPKKVGAWKFVTYVMPMAFGLYIVNFNSKRFITAEDFVHMVRARRDPNYVPPEPQPEPSQETPSDKPTEFPFQFLAETNLKFDEEGMKGFFKSRYEITREMMHQFIVGYRESLGREIKPRATSQIEGGLSTESWNEKIRQFAEKTRKWRDEFSNISKISEEDLKK